MGNKRGFHVAVFARAVVRSKSVLTTLLPSSLSPLVVSARRTVSPFRS